MNEYSGPQMGMGVPQKGIQGSLSYYRIPNNWCKIKLGHWLNTPTFQGTSLMKSGIYSESLNKAQAGRIPDAPSGIAIGPS